VCMGLSFYLSANYYFVAPRGQFSFLLHEDAAGLAVNIISAALLIYLGAYAKRASVALQLSNAAAEKANTDLAKANESIAASHEELAAMNEELAATNEELETVNEALAKANTELTEASERKDQFLSTLSHELRNPMSSITMSAYMLEHSKSWNETSAHAVEVLVRQSRHMKALLDDLLDKRRIATGNFELKRAVADVRACIDDGIESHRPLLERRKQTLKLTLPRTPVNAYVDARRVTQIVANLVGNAVKHTNEHTLIDVSLIEKDGKVVISVRDNGPGIAADLQSHLFEPFQSKKGPAHSSGGGLGIGLALTKGLVEMHGGTITVISTGVGAGAIFTVKLPAAESSVSEQVEKKAVSPSR
jgi:signal transduction histidine kinase